MRLNADTFKLFGDTVGSRHRYSLGDETKPSILAEAVVVENTLLVQQEYSPVRSG